MNIRTLRIQSCCAYAKCASALAECRVVVCVLSPVTSSKPPYCETYAFIPFECVSCNPLSKWTQSLFLHVVLHPCRCHITPILIVHVWVFEHIHEDMHHSNQIDSSHCWLKYAPQPCLCSPDWSGSSLEASFGVGLAAFALAGRIRVAALPSCSSTRSSRRPW